MNPIADQINVIVVGLVGLIALLIPIIWMTVRERLQVWANKKWEELQRNTPEATIALLETVARIVVPAVEQMWKGQQQAGKEKLQEAERRIEEWLLQHGVTVELSQIRLAIEAVVWELNETSDT